uniref:Uncharacterized protein n=1 Tax=Meloidogyne hapla TaxID=6305 RepID=A0A1I8BHV7_MELHA
MDDVDPSLSNKEPLLELAESISPARMFIYNQISKSFCWISYSCIYLQEMLRYSTSIWQQSSEAFHQRVFAIVNNNKPAGILTESNPIQKEGSEGALSMCKDLLMLIEEKQSSDLLNKFFNSPTSYKETKQACSFLDDYSTLIKGISSGVLPASQQLRHEIRTLHAYLTTLSTNMEDENDADPVSMYTLLSMLLDTLLKIASGHTAFNLSLGWEQNFHQFFDQFEHSVYLLEQRLENILQVAEKNSLKNSFDLRAYFSVNVPENCNILFEDKEELDDEESNNSDE